MDQLHYSQSRRTDKFIVPSYSYTIVQMEILHVIQVPLYGTCYHIITNIFLTIPLKEKIKKPLLLENAINASIEDPWWFASEFWKSTLILPVEYITRLTERSKPDKLNMRASCSCGKNDTMLRNFFRDGPSFARKHIKIF